MDWQDCMVHDRRNLLVFLICSWISSTEKNCIWRKSFVATAMFCASRNSINTKAFVCFCFRSWFFTFLWNSKCSCLVCEEKDMPKLVAYLNYGRHVFQLTHISHRMVFPFSTKDPNMMLGMLSPYNSNSIKSVFCLWFSASTTSDCFIALDWKAAQETTWINSSPASICSRDRWRHRCYRWTASSASNWRRYSIRAYQCPNV